MSQTIETAPELVADALRDALAELRRPLNGDGNGWKKGSAGTADSCKCLDAALYWVSRRGLEHERTALSHALRSRVAEVIADIEGVDIPWSAAPLIWAWNDHEDRVFPEVEAVLERAIALTEQVPA